MTPTDALELEERRTENLESLFWDAHRPFVPIREAFLQIRGRPPTPGPLSELVRKRRLHALDLYLLLHVAAAPPRYRLSVDPQFWGVLVRSPSQSQRNARLAFHRSLDYLESLGLVRRENRRGVPRIQLLDERGTGEGYVHPAERGERYLTLPHTYWTGGFDRKLDLPGKAVLLIARSLKPDGFTLPLAHAREWYGLSADTLRRGIRELIKVGLVRYTPDSVPSADAPLGMTIRRTYKLVGPMTRAVHTEAPASARTNERSLQR